MEHYKKIAQYWKDSLADKQYTQAQFRVSTFDKSFVWNVNDTFIRVNNVDVLQSLPFEAKSYAELSYLPFVFKRQGLRHQSICSYKPEILALIHIKIEVSEHGFIYPVSYPVIPRDILLPLDKDSFHIGHIDVYERFITQYPAPIFERDDTAVWEVYYNELITKKYRKGLLNKLYKEGLLTVKDMQADYNELMFRLFKNRIKAKKFTIFCREYNNIWNDRILEILATDKKFQNKIQVYLGLWSDYLNYIDQLLEAMVLDTTLISEYEKANVSYFAADETDITSKIVAVYDNLITSPIEHNFNLFRNFTALEEYAEQEIPASKLTFSKRLGHNNNRYPLADAQRQALTALLVAKPGDILAVNGPPGTGKTTMLLSVVANLWVASAIREEQPPVIIASSTNNQAVTNIIDSFAKDFSSGNGEFAGRWINGLESFGCYFVSASREDEAIKRGYQTEQIIMMIETEEFYYEAQSCYLNKAQQALRTANISVKQAVNRLHLLLVEKQQFLLDLEQTYHDYHQVGASLASILNIDYTDKKQRIELRNTHKKQYDELLKLGEEWERYLASESLFLSLFSFLSFVRRRRNLKAKVFAQEYAYSKYLSLEDFEVADVYEQLAQKRDSVAALVDQLDLLESTHQRLIELLLQLDRGLTSNSNLTEIDQIADVKVRFELFLLATHYWEGRWLLDMQQLISDKQLDRINWKYENIRKDNWRRRMKLMPCAVMTSYMLPEYFTYKQSGHTYHMYDFIDLLIVDEAGQVSPEVAGAGFALSKKALVIGDTQQIAPIAELTKSIDMGNLQQINILDSQLTLIDANDAYTQLQAKGVTPNGGSAMRIAQCRTKYFPEKGLERGLYLYEHRRCYDEIIGFCNELCYKGVLKPVRGGAQNNLLPPMGYLHIDGKCQNVQGSKRNKIEAKLIAGWIINNYTRLLQAYPGRAIKDIVAVITPFRAQTQEILAYLHKPNVRYSHLRSELEQITVGTIHSLQGAEREIVLFSPTYSRHNTGTFIDSDSSMLNVAVSRAKDSFLVFGDMSLFNPELNTPTGILARYLMNEPSQSLVYQYQYSKAFIREDLLSTERSIELLKNYEAHDTFLKDVFHKAQKRVIIISPWLIYTTLEANGYVELLSNSQITIDIYTDKYFNTRTLNRKDPQKERQFKEAVEKLTCLGVNIHIKESIHSKIVIKDEDTLCVGSFNWFSAQRGGTYTKTEHSIVYRGENVKNEIDTFLSTLSNN